MFFKNMKKGIVTMNKTWFWNKGIWNTAEWGSFFLNTGNENIYKDVKSLQVLWLKLL